MPRPLRAEERDSDLVGDESTQAGGRAACASLPGVAGPGRARGRGVRAAPGVSPRGRAGRARGSSRCAEPGGACRAASGLARLGPPRGRVRTQGLCRLRGFSVPGDEQLDRVAAEGLTAAGGEERVARPAATLAQPGAEHPDHLQGERGAAFLTALSQAPDVRAGAQVHVGAGERGELGDPQPGLDGHRQQGMVAAADPAGQVRGASGTSASGGRRRPALSKRAGGMARTRWIRAACSGWRRAE